MISSNLICVQNKIKENYIFTFDCLCKVYIVVKKIVHFFPKMTNISLIEKNVCIEYVQFPSASHIYKITCLFT